MKIEKEGKTIYVCECGKEFDKRKAFIGHCGHCKKHLEHKPTNNNNLHKQDDYYTPGKCQYCGKDCKNQNSLKQHEIRCKKNPNKIDTSKSWNNGNRPAWNKGLTKETDERIKKGSNTYKENYKSGLHKKFTGKGKTPEKEQERCKKLSEIAKKRHFGGLNPYIGRGSKSILIYKNKQIMFRSSWEFIYALYLAENNIDFNYENITLPAIKENKYSKNLTCDFNIGNKIIEVKGYRSLKDDIIKETFKNGGYEFKEIFDIKPYSDYLDNKGYDSKQIIKDIIHGNKYKNYYTFDFNSKKVLTDFIVKRKLIQKIITVINKIIYEKKMKEILLNIQKIINDKKLDITTYNGMKDLSKIIKRKTLKQVFDYYNISYYKHKSFGNGSKNSQYGKHWYINPDKTESKIFKEGEQPCEWILGRIIK